MNKSDAFSCAFDKSTKINRANTTNNIDMDQGAEILYELFLYYPVHFISQIRRFIHLEVDHPSACH